MKKILIFIAASAVAVSANSFDLKGLVDKATSSAGDASQVGDLVSGLVSNVTATSNFDVDDIVGTWDYSSPAVTFDSDNILSSVGGAGASSIIEGKLAPYYNRFGLNKMTLTVESDHTFTMSNGTHSLTGVIEKDSNGELVFNFKAFQSINIGKVKTMAEKSGNTLTLTFDVTKLKSIIEAVSSVSNNQTIKAASSLLSSYDGIFAGFKLKKK